MQTTINVDEDVGEKVHPYIAGGTANWYNHYGNQYGDFLENLKCSRNLTQLSHSSVYAQKDLKSAYYSDAAMSMFIAAQLTIAKLWNQTRCPSTDEWIKNI